VMNAIDKMRASSPPKELVPLTHAERCHLFGCFSFTPSPTPGDPERVTIDHVWEYANLVTIRVPQLEGKSVRIHRKVMQPFLDLFAAWEKAGLVKYLLTFDGCWCPRFKRQMGTLEQRRQECAHCTENDLSNHCWGSAFDINSHWNPLGKPATEGTGTVLPLVDLAAEHGFGWGGAWRRPDAMHMEYVGGKNGNA
jgi:hypothetical protein